jgi:hypothetical protein
LPCDQRRHLVHAGLAVGIEGDVVQTRLVDFERMLRELALRLPDVEGDVGLRIQVDRHPRAGIEAALAVGIAH